MQLFLISGLSGSGKTVALRMLEDVGFTCIDNLPVRLLRNYVQEELRGLHGSKRRIAIGIDVRAGETDLRDLPELARSLDSNEINCQIVYLTSDDETLIRRYGETRRTHPLAQRDGGIAAAIAEERRLLQPMAENADLVIDTTLLNVHDLRQLIRARLLGADSRISLMFQSFGYKHGTPRDADFVFDVRCLPNPYWDETLRQYNGNEQPVIDFLAREDSVAEMLKDIGDFLDRWLDKFEASDRSYMTIAIGCTGGRHRSVYIAERLAARFSKQFPNTIVRHISLSELLEGEQLSLLGMAR